MMKLFEIAQSKYDKEIPVKQRIIIGFRPYTSDNAPTIGMHRNCRNEYIDPKNPKKKIKILLN